MSDWFNRNGGTFLGSIAGGLFDLAGSAIQQKYNRELASYQNQLAIEQWQRENEYNLPVNQMARLKQAGLNPNLVYANGANVQSAHSPQLTAGDAANYQGAFSNIGNNIMHVLTNLFSIKRQYHDERKAEADADKAEYDALIRRVDAMEKTGDYYFDYQRTDDDVNEQTSNNFVPVVGWSYGRDKVLSPDVNVNSLKSKIKYYTSPELDYDLKSENLHLTKEKQKEVKERVGLLQEQIKYLVEKTKIVKTEAELLDTYGEIEKIIDLISKGTDVILSIPKTYFNTIKKFAPKKGKK